MSAIGPCQRTMPPCSIATSVGDGAHGGHVVGDGDGGGAHLGDQLADQVVDDAGHDRVEAGGGLVEEDDGGVGGDGAGEADALLHAARELGRVEVGGLGPEADAARACRWRARGRPRGEQRLAGVAQAEGDVLPDRQAVEERAALEQHAEVAQEGAAVDRGEGHAVDQDLAAVGREDAEDAFQRHRLAGARAADDDEALAGHDLERDAGRAPACAPKALLHVDELDARHRARRCRASEEGLGQQVVGGEDQDRGRDHRVGRRLADALGAAAGVVAVVAAHQRRAGSRRPPP